MPITGYYDGSVIQVSEPLKKNQEVLIIPLEERELTGTSAAGGLKKYADPSLVDKEKRAWERAVVAKHGE